VGRSVESGYGLHVVLVRKRLAAQPPDLDAVRPLVEREVMAERSKQELHKLYERLLAKYTVTVETPQPPDAGAAAVVGSAP